MELQEFIASSLMAIIEAVSETQKRCRDSQVDAFVSVAQKIARGNTPRPYEQWRSPVIVEFDVAVTVQDTANRGASGKIGIRAAGVGIEGSAATSEGQENRLKFSIPIVLPDGIPLRTEANERGGA